MAGSTLGAVLPHCGHGRADSQEKRRRLPALKLTLNVGSEGYDGHLHLLATGVP